MFKPSTSAVVQDWITPPHVEVISVMTQRDRFERIKRRVKELQQQMGPRYLCHEKNRVPRLDGRVYKPRDTTHVNVRLVRRKLAA
jgi:hypothetical protein